MCATIVVASRMPTASMNVHTAAYADPLMGTSLLQLSFTGSPEVGKLVAAAAARNVVPCTLELVSAVASYCCAPGCCIREKVVQE